MIRETVFRAEGNEICLGSDGCNGSCDLMLNVHH